MKYLVRNKKFYLNNIIYQSTNLMFTKKKKLFPGAEKFYENTVSIPIFVDLKLAQQKKVIKVIKNYLKH